MKNYNNKIKSKDLSNLGPDSIVDALGPPHDLPVNNGELNKSIIRPEIYSGTPIEEIGILKPDVKLKNIDKITSKGELSNSESYMETNFSTLQRNLDKIGEVFENKIVVDLGAGKTTLGYSMALMAGAKAYVGVDSHNANSLGRFLNGNHNDSMTYSVVDLDMLSFLRCVKDDSISMIAAGIDDYVIHDGEYTNPLNKEIKRTLHPNGGLLSVMSEIYFPDKDKRIIIDGGGRSYIGSQIAILRK
jgi:hypothetical protein